MLQRSEPRHLDHRSGSDLVIDMKVCSKCNIEKEVTEFFKNEHRKDGLNSQCKLCHVETSRVSRFLCNYGITLVENLQQMIDAQSGKCAICGEVLQRGQGLAIDHDHISGELREVLCSTCNVGLGFFKDNSAVLRSAADYIDKHKTPP